MQGQSCSPKLLPPLPAAGETLRFGRDTVNHVVLPNREVSRFHAELVCQAGTYLLKDWNSHNGTYVNGNEITSVPLKAGDLIEIGSYKFRFSGARLELMDGQLSDDLHTFNKHPKTCRLAGAKKWVGSEKTCAPAGRVKRLPRLWGSGRQPGFQYMARDHRGEIVCGVVHAPTVSDALDSLTSNRLRVIEIKPALFAVGRPRRLDSQSVVLMTRRLATMLTAGLSMQRCLRSMGEQEEDLELRSILTSMLADISSGASLSWAAARHPQAFNSVYVCLLKIGETTGHMPAMISRLADFLERDLKLRRQARSALTYPVLVSSICLAVVALIFVCILPPLLNVFASLASEHMQLPLPTRMLTSVCAVVGRPWCQFLAMAVCVYLRVHFRDYMKTHQGRLALDHLKLTAPLIGAMNRKVLIAHFSGALGLMMAAGVPALKSLQSVADFIDNEYFRSALGPRLVGGLREGESMSTTFLATGFFPPMLCSMVAVGETTGDMHHMLGRISAICQDEVQQGLEQFLVLIEPMLIGILGLIVGFILLSVFLPLYQVIMHL